MNRKIRDKYNKSLHFVPLLLMFLFKCDRAEGEGVLFFYLSLHSLALISFRSFARFARFVLYIYYLSIQSLISFGPSLFSYRFIQFILHSTSFHSVFFHYTSDLVTFSFRFATFQTPLQSLQFIPFRLHFITSSLHFFQFFLSFRSTSFHFISIPILFGFTSLCSENLNVPLPLCSSSTSILALGFASFYSLRSQNSTHFLRLPFNFLKMSFVSLSPYISNLFLVLYLQSKETREAPVCGV